MKIDNLITTDLFNSLKTIGETDVIAKRVLTKEYVDFADLLNSLTSALICVYYRETSNQLLVKEMIDSNPQVKAILQAKNDTIDVPQ